MIKNFLIIILCSIALSSCDFLNFDESQGMTKDEAYSYFGNVTRLASAVYYEIPADYGDISKAMRESASDNSVYTWSNNTIYDMYVDAWSPLNLIDDNWSELYTAIRRANSFLENYSDENLERFKWTTDYEKNIKVVRMHTNEVLVLRAYYHFELAKRYGDIPLIKRTYSSEEINLVVKTPFQEVIADIVAECSAVTENLPISHDKDFYGDTGRITRGAAMAIKARALIYAASSLHNSGNDKSLWEKAALASRDIINSNIYSLPNIEDDPLYDEFGGHEVLKSPQMIFERRGGSSNTFERNNLPIGFDDANSGNTPTQNFVDAFEMKNGDVFDWTDSEHVRNIYYNDRDQSRDPRLYLNVICNGTVYMKTTVETYVGGKHGSPIEGATLTGYYLRKLMNEKVSLSPITPITLPHHFPLFRYAEVLLNYAEAMSEWQGADYVDGDYTLSARAALNQVRTSANMPDVMATGDEFTERLRNERRVELAFEDHRFWDIRRWKIGDVVEDIYGVKIRSVGVLTYEKVLVQNRIWDDKMYLYPIPQSEIYKNANLLPQNPGW